MREQSDRHNRLKRARSYKKNILPLASGLLLLALRAARRNAKARALAFAQASEAERDGIHTNHCLSKYEKNTFCFCSLASCIGFLQ